MFKPILVLDFDGVIHSYKTGWHGAAHVSDPPVAGAKEAVEEYLNHFEVAIFSSRSNQDGGITAMKNWLQHYGFPVDKLSFPTVKPPAFLSIDDRVICFNGFFPTVETIKNFKPWNK